MGAITLKPTIRQPTYNPLEYWTERGKTYYENFKYGEAYRLQERAILEHLKTLSFETVLEVGCGFGRITRLIRDNFSLKEYHAIDLSEHQIAKARELARGVQFETCTIQAFNTYRKYDLVIACEVLLHVPPPEIRAVVEKLEGLSSKYVVNIDPYMMEVGELEPHNFLHDYGAIRRGAAFIPIEGAGQYIISSYNK